MAKAHRFKHTAARSKVAMRMRGMSPTMAKSYYKAAGKPKAAKKSRRAKPKSVPVRTITKTVHHTKYIKRPKPKRSVGHAYHAGKAVGETLGEALGSGEHRQ